MLGKRGSWLFFDCFIGGSLSFQITFGLGCGISGDWTAAWKEAKFISQMDLVRCALAELRTFFEEASRAAAWDTAARLVGSNRKMVRTESRFFVASST